MREPRPALYFDGADTFSRMRALCAGPSRLKRRPEWKRAVWWKHALKVDAQGRDLIGKVYRLWRVA